VGSLRPDHTETHRRGARKGWKRKGCCPHTIPLSCPNSHSRGSNLVLNASFFPAPPCSALLVVVTPHPAAAAVVAPAAAAAAAAGRVPCARTVLTRERSCFSAMALSPYLGRRAHAHAHSQAAVCGQAGPEYFAGWPQCHGSHSLVDQPVLEESAEGGARVGGLIVDAVGGHLVFKDTRDQPFCLHRYDRSISARWPPSSGWLAGWLAGSLARYLVEGHRLCALGERRARDSPAVPVALSERRRTGLRLDRPIPPPAAGLQQADTQQRRLILLLLLLLLSCGSDLISELRLHTRIVMTRRRGGKGRGGGTCRRRHGRRVM
jgi:hypothetical protein